MDQSTGGATYSVSELAAAVNRALMAAFADEVWVRGEIHDLSRPASGHVYFTLVEADSRGGPPTAMVPVTLFDNERRVVNATLARTGAVRMTDGTEVRIRGRLAYWPPRGQLQLRMTAIDPEYTLGRLAAERERLLRRLDGEGLLTRNRARPLPAVPHRVGLVTSAGSAACIDFLHELEASGLGWRVELADTRVQGAGAEAAVVAALERLARRRPDVVAVVRGGGARTDLAAFDGEAVARAIAAMPVPVLTGIGHEIDTSVADLAAAHAFKTPTACAGWLVERTSRFCAEVDVARGRLGSLARRRLDRADAHLAGRGRSVGTAAHTRLGLASARIEDTARRARREASQAFARAERHVAQADARVRSLDPVLALKRGWTITRDGDGRVVRTVTQLQPGADLDTRFADGSARSRVLSVARGEPSADGP